GSFFRTRSSCLGSQNTAFFCGFSSMNCLPIGSPAFLLLMCWFPLLSSVYLFPEKVAASACALAGCPSWPRYSSAFLSACHCSCIFGKSSLIEQRPKQAMQLTLVNKRKRRAADR